MARKIPKFDSRTFANLFPLTGSQMGFKKRMQMWDQYYSKKK